MYILFKPLAAFPHNHCRKNGQWRERNDPVAMTISLSAILGKKSFENTVGKGEIARNEQFLLFPTVFYIRLANFVPFSSNLNCRLQTL